MKSVAEQCRTPAACFYPSGQAEAGASESVPVTRSAFVKIIVKFNVRMDSFKLLKSFVGGADGFETFEKLADKRKSNYDLDSAEEQIYHYLCLCLDRNSLSIIRRGAKDVGVEAVTTRQSSTGQSPPDSP